MLHALIVLGFHCLRVSFLLLRVFLNLRLYNVRRPRLLPHRLLLTLRRRLRRRRGLLGLLVRSLLQRRRVQRRLGFRFHHQRHAMV